MIIAHFMIEWETAMRDKKFSTANLIRNDIKTILISEFVKSLIIRDMQVTSMYQRAEQMADMVLDKGGFRVVCENETDNKDDVKIKELMDYMRKSNKNMN